jgi:hypothetical protein
MFSICPMHTCYTHYIFSDLMHKTKLTYTLC